jgi:outer membrane immunogenic protein
MKKVLVGTVFVLGRLTAAAADDLPVAKPEYASNSPNYSWTGFYLGDYLGGVRGRSDLRTTAALTGPGIEFPAGYFQATSIPAIRAVGAQSTKSSGVTGGITGGYNWQISNLVLSFETDFGYLGLRGVSTSSAIYPCCAPTGFIIQSSARSDFLFTARPRIGLAHSGVLAFVSGGFAVSRLNSDFTFSDNNSAATASGSASSMAVGYAVGGGIEARVGGHWSFKTEYLYIDLGRISAASSNLTTTYGRSPLNVFTHSADLIASLVRLGVNFRF